MRPISRREALASISAAGLLFSQTAQAQAFPTRPLRMVVSYAAGGSSDAVARQIAHKLSDSLHQSVLVDNRPGGNSAIGVNFVASQPADGYTMLLIDPSQFIVNPHVYKKLTYDAAGFEPVAMLHRYPFMLVVHPNHPARTLSEFVASVKARPAGINYGSAGSGTPLHLGMEMVNSATGMQGVHVPYKGTAPALNDLMGGQVEAVFADVATALQFVQAGKLRALAVSSPVRHELLPGIPTFVESGYPQIQVNGWFGVAVKRGTPAAVVQKLNAAVLSAVADPGVSHWMRSIAAIPAPLPNTSQDFAQVMRQDYQMWGKVARELKIQLD